MFRKITGLALSIVFVISSLHMPQAQAGEMVLSLMPKPGAMVQPSRAYVPSYLQGITIHPDNALQFDFLVRKGQSGLDSAQKMIEYKKLVKYFLASLTIPDEDQWVNLSPYEHSRIIKDDFGRTEMGRDLLTQDYLLKQFTSSLMYPETGLGKKFWARVYERAEKEYGSTNVPVNTFNKVWITPDEAVVYESGNTAYILKSHLKVMLEQDYLALVKRKVKQQSSTLTSSIMRQIIIPEIEKEVNDGKNFAMLRQIYSGMVLAAWYKKALKESLLGKIYADKNKIAGIDHETSINDVEKIYHRYLQAVRKGVFNYIQEDMDTYSQQVVPRKYFAGGFAPNLNHAMVVVTPATLTSGLAVLAARALSGLRQQGVMDMARVNLRPDVGLPGRKILRSMGVAVLGLTFVVSSGAVMPIDSKALTLQAQQFIAVQNTRLGLKFPEGQVLNLSAEKALNSRLDNFLKQHRNELDGLPALKGFIANQKLDLSKDPYTNLVKALKAYFDGLRGRLKTLNTQQLDAWSDLQADTVQFIQEFLIEDASYSSLQRSVAGLIFGLPDQGFVYNCDSISALTVVIGNEMGINGINYANVLRDNLGHDLPTDNFRNVPGEFGHSNNVLIKANGKAVVFDQGLKIGPDNPYELLESYDNNGKPVQISLSSVGPKAKFWKLSDLLKLERAFYQLKQLEVDGVYSTVKYKNNKDLINEKIILDGIAASGVLRLDSVLKENFEKALGIFKLAQEDFTLRNQGIVHTNPPKAKFPSNQNSLVTKVTLSAPSILDRVKGLLGRTDKAQLNDLGGIDLNAANLNLQIKRDGHGVVLPWPKQDMAQLSRIPGFVPEIIEIRSVNSLPILNELQKISGQYTR